MSPEQLADRARTALEQGEEELALAHLDRWLSENGENATILQWKGLLHRALDQRDEAITALQKAAGLAPDYGLLAHTLARVTHEAGLDAEALYERAIALLPADPDVRLGYVAACYSVGRGPQGLEYLDTLLISNPGWLQGHRHYAQLAAMLGRSDQALASIERALATYPNDLSLHLLGMELMLEAEHHEQALDLARRATALGVVAAELLMYQASALDELGRTDEAVPIFDHLGTASQPSHAIRRLRHLLRRGAVKQANDELEPWLKRPGNENFWPYASLAWRAAGDVRADWLDGQPGLVSVVDLPADEIDMAELGEFLRGLHRGSGRFLDQSVRNGTQTDGALLSRTEPVIKRLRSSLSRAVANHIAQLPVADAAHPVLGQRRDRQPRFAGSWSVRLTGSGFHASHHHPQGWISSALYVAVPTVLEGEDGHLALGESPADLRLNLPPRQIVRPQAGRLVLFPSHMWHGTRPFADGERITVAFDVLRY